YRLAGEFNETAGYGQKDETFNALDALRAMGEKTWFRIGDKDLATHVLRAEMLRRGATLTEASLELCRRFSLKSRVVPMSEDAVAVSPIVGGRALKGPTVEMMRAMDLDPSPVEVARRYRDRCSGFVLDARDSQLREQIEKMDYRVLECDTVMDDGGARLARE